MELQLDVHEVVLELIDLNIELLFEARIVEVILGVGLVLELLLPEGDELVNEPNGLDLGLLLGLLEDLLAVGDSVHLLLVADLHVMVELLSELVDGSVVRLEDLVELRHMREHLGLWVLTDYTRDHPYCAVDLRGLELRVCLLLKLLRLSSFLVLLRFLLVELLTMLFHGCPPVFLYD